MRGYLIAIALAFVAATAAPVRANDNPHLLTTPTFAAATYALQQNPVHVNVNHGDRAWYRNPVWIAILVLAGIVLLVLLMLAFRGTGGGGTTILRE